MGHREKGHLDSMTAKNLAIKVGIRRNLGDLAQRFDLHGQIAHNLARTECWPLSRFLTGQRSCLALFIAMVVVSMAGCQSAPHPEAPALSAGRHGGEIAVSMRTEPRSFNRFVARDTGTALVGLLTQGRLSGQSGDSGGRTRLAELGTSPTAFASPEAAPGCGLL
jgi:hypothetical protein